MTEIFTAVIGVVLGIVIIYGLVVLAAIAIGAIIAIVQDIFGG